MTTPQEFVDSVLGHQYGDGQCVAGFKYFCKYYYGIDLGTICDPTNHATSIWDNYEKYGFDKYFDKVRGDSMVDGDWAIWDMGSLSCPYSHVAMFRRDNDCNIGIFLGQNQLGYKEFTQVGINYNGIRGAFRPKIYHEDPQPTPPIPVQYPIYQTIGEMYVRTSPAGNHTLVTDLTADGKAHATSTNPYAWAVYKAGTNFTVYEEKDFNGGIWGRSPSGWICLKGASGRVYCNRVE